MDNLVRDGIFEYMLDKQCPDYKILSDEEILDALKQKILEECNEFDPKKPNAIEELADILEVVEQLTKELGEDFETLRNEQLKKRKKSGGFEKRAYVRTLHLQDDDRWIEYYAKDPKRFVEIKE